MIDIPKLSAMVPELTGDAVKVGLHIAVHLRGASDARADAAWRAGCAASVGLSPEVVRTVLRELDAAGLVRFERGCRLCPPVQSAGVIDPSRSPANTMDSQEASPEARSDGSAALSPPGGMPRARLDLDGFPSDPTTGDLAPWESGTSEIRNPKEQPSEATADRPEGGSQGMGGGGADLRPVPSAAGSPQVPRARRNRPSTLPGPGGDNGELRALRRGGLQAAIDAFHTGFIAAYQAAPSWNGKTCTLMRQLIDDHGVDEVVRRIGIMWNTPPPWPPPPYTVDTLRFHFDRFATASPPRGGVVDAGRTGPAYYEGT